LIIIGYDLLKGFQSEKPQVSFQYNKGSPFINLRRHNPSHEKNFTRFLFHPSI